MRAIRSTHALCVSHPKALQSAPPHRSNRSQRHRQKRNRRILAIGITAAIAGAVFSPQSENQIVTESTNQPQIGFTEHAVPSTIPPENITDSLAFTERSDSTPQLLSSIGMSRNTQLEIYMEACHCDPELFAAVMAIGTTESGLNPNAIGDGGDSIGMMQINTHWQKDRINRLGITDLTDPAQNALVAVDYIEWIIENLGTGSDGLYSNDLYMAYNMGWRGYREAYTAGYNSTEYSITTLSTFHTYLQEINGGEE